MWKYLCVFAVFAVTACEDKVAISQPTPQEQGDAGVERMSAETVTVVGRRDIDLAVAELTELEEKILEVALTCKRAKPQHKDKNLLIDLLLMERHFEIPRDMRGMLLASACTESGYNPNAEGDHKFSKTGKPKAIGLLQLWYWWTLPVERGGYAVDRRDPRANAYAWMSHIKKVYPKVRKKCKISRKHISRIWRVAWVTAIRAPKPEGRCNEFPNHYHRLKKWKRQWQSLL